MDPNSSGSAKKNMRCCSALFLKDLKKSTVKDQLEASERYAHEISSQKKISKCRICRNSNLAKNRPTAGNLKMVSPATQQNYEYQMSNRRDRRAIIVPGETSAYRV